MVFLVVYIILSLILSRRILKSNIFNIASFALIAYWTSYPIEKFTIAEEVIQNIDNVKKEGVYLFAIFGFAFLLGVFIFSKIKFNKLEYYPSIKSEKNLLFISIFLGFLGLLCFSYTYNFSIIEYFNLTLGLQRSEKIALLGTAKNSLPYSIFFIPSITTVLLSIKIYGLKNSFSKTFFTFLIFLINCPILLSYLIEGDRTSLIKLSFVSLFIFGLGKASVETKKENNFLIKNFRINKKILFHRIKIFLILIILFFMLIFIGYGRTLKFKGESSLNREGNTTIIQIIQNKYKDKIFPVAEFRGVNYTIDYALARDSLNIEKTDKMFTWEKLIFYPLPTYVYKGIFNEKKPPNIGRLIGLETKKIINDDENIGFGLSPVAEGYVNFGYLGVCIIGVVYGLSVGFLQFFYNKISLERINLLDIFVINILGIVPLIMRTGSAGIYNYIFSTSFAILLPLLIIDIFQRKNFRNFQNKNL